MLETEPPLTPISAESSRRGSHRPPSTGGRAASSASRQLSLPNRSLHRDDDGDHDEGDLEHRAGANAAITAPTATPTTAGTAHAPHDLIGSTAPWRDARGRSGSWSAR